MLKQNTRLMIMILLLSLILIIIIIFLHIKTRRTFIESFIEMPHFTHIKWNRNKCNKKMTKMLQKVFTNNNIKKTLKVEEANLYLPCTYNYIDHEISIIPKNKSGYYFIVNNADQLAGKDSLWEKLVEKYGRKMASTIMPTTYILSNAKDRELFINEFEETPNTIYIMKKNIQQQKGLKITNDKNTILRSKGYVVVQKLLQDPYTINGRKINMRFYILFVCRNGEVSAYAHKKGFMYYTAELFEKRSTKIGPNITTGYIDRSIYEINPLTFDDFKAYLDQNIDEIGRNYNNRAITDNEMKLKNMNDQTLSEITFNRIYWLLRKIVVAVRNKVCQGSKLESALTFQLFGADIALNDKLEPQIMEVNKGPDIGFKDERDGTLKYQVMEDIFRVLSIIPGKHKFKKLI